MNNKTIELSSLKDFDDVSGEYKLTCICGAVTVIKPDQLLQNHILIRCKGCYLQYDIHVSNMEIGIAYYYLQNYSEAIRHYLIHQRECEDDSQTVEFNVYDALCQLYDHQSTEEGRNECITMFSTLYPDSHYDLINRQPTESLLTPSALETYFKDRLSTIQSLCKEIKDNR
ncbi:hypothetical protein WA171_003959 [Blastocystis sp. BT1]